MAIKYALGAVLSATTFWVLVVYYLLQLGPADGPNDQMDFMRHPRVRQLMADQNEPDAIIQDPNRLAQVNVHSAEKEENLESAEGTEEGTEVPCEHPPCPVSPSKKKHERKTDDAKEIVFGVCCRKDYSAIEALSKEFISVFYTTAIEPLQKATAMTPLKAQDAAAVAAGHMDFDRLSTLLSTEDITVTYQVKRHTLHHASGTTKDVQHDGSMAPLMMTFTIKGESLFLANFMHQLWFKSPLLESGIYTTIEAHLLHNDADHRQGVLAVRWVSPRYKVPVVSLNSMHVGDLMNELDSATGIYQGVSANHAIDSAALLRQERRSKALQLEKNSLSQLIRQASHCVYPRLNVAFNQLILGEMRHLKTRSFYIQRQIESLQLQHDSLSRVLKQTEREYKFEDANAKSNTINIAHLEERLNLLHHRRVEIIAELKKMVKRFEYMAHLIVYYEIYLREKQRHEAKFRGERFQFEHGLCAHRIDGFECNRRAIFCSADNDLFAGDDVVITAEVVVSASFAHSIYLFGNDECESLRLEKDMEHNSLTTHHCKKGATGPCDMTAGGLQAMEKQLHVVCVYVGCAAEHAFNVSTKIELQPNRTIAEAAAPQTEEAVEGGAVAPERDSSEDGKMAWIKELRGSKATVTVTKKDEAVAVVVPPVEGKPGAPKPKDAGEKESSEEKDEYSPSAGSELHRTATLVGTVFFSAVALIMSVLFLPTLLR